MTNIGLSGTTTLEMANRNRFVPNSFYQNPVNRIPIESSNSYEVPKTIKLGGTHSYKMRGVYKSSSADDLTICLRDCYKYLIENSIQPPDDFEEIFEENFDFFCKG